MKVLKTIKQYFSKNRNCINNKDDNKLNKYECTEISTSIIEEQEEVLDSKCLCYKFFYKFLPQPHGPKSKKYSEYTVYEGHFIQNSIERYYFFSIEDCSIKNILYLLDYGDTLIEIQNNDELVKNTRKANLGWASFKIETGQSYEYDSLVLYNLLEESVRQTVSLKLTSKNISDIKDIMIKLIMQLSIKNVFRLEHFLNDEYNYKLSYSDKTEIVTWCKRKLSCVRGNDYEEKKSDIIAQLEQWLNE